MSTEPFYTPLSQPASKLGRYRLLSTTAGVHVSPLCLGAMSIGDKWHRYGMGSMDKESSFKLLDAYFDLGGNFIDTANQYQDQTSEQFIGEWAEQRGIRDQLFIATKYTNNARERDPTLAQKVLYIGNSAKSMYISIDASLKNLRTDYVDLFYVHWWDYDTSIEEVMRALHILVLERKVIYLGISDTPAWIVSKANQYARDHGLTPFSVYQGQWNIMERDFERDIIPMARSEGMALCPFGVLAGGKIRTDAEEATRLRTGEKGRTWFGDWMRDDHEKAVCKALEKIAAQVGASSIHAVAIAYLMHKATFVFPIIGGRKVEQLRDNIAALDVVLSPEHIKELDDVVPFNPGFPGNIFGDGSYYPIMFSANAHIDKWPVAQPITPQKDQPTVSTELKG